MPRGWLGTEHLEDDPECSWGAGGVPYEFDRCGCDMTRAPYLEHDTLELVERAVESLARGRGSSPGDAGTALSCLASFIAEAHSQFPAVVAEARFHGYSWAVTRWWVSLPTREG